MKKILVFGASNSASSINKQLAFYAASTINGAEKTYIDLKDFPLPLYCIDDQKAEGFPEKASEFHQLLENHDGYIISLAEHNHNFTSVFKNIIDWVSRMDRNMWKGKPMLLLSTSPGGRGGRNVMDIALSSMKMMGANITGHLCLPSFYDNFKPEQGILQEALQQELVEKVASFMQVLTEQ
ncbi:MAG: NAD(P)H-dependent oxidoreductase [Bacteroidota bacterium]